jgi:hypothetical protein
LSPSGETRTIADSYSLQVYRPIYGNVYEKSTGPGPATMQLPRFLRKSSFRADYQQQYLAKNPDGYCPDHSRGALQIREVTRG